MQALMFPPGQLFLFNLVGMPVRYNCGYLCYGKIKQRAGNCFGKLVKLRFYFYSSGYSRLLFCPFQRNSRQKNAIASKIDSTLNLTKLSAPTVCVDPNRYLRVPMYLGPVDLLATHSLVPQSRRSRQRTRIRRSSAEPPAAAH